MLTGKEVAKYLLEHHNIFNFEIKQTKSSSTGSCCKYRPHGKTVIYLYKEHYDSPGLDNMFVGAHEASHVLIYNSDNSYFYKVKNSERMFSFLFVSTIIIYALAGLFSQIILYFLMVLCSAILLAYAKIYGNILRMDEVKADSLALQLIESDETFKDIKGVKHCYESRSKIIKDKVIFIYLVTVCGSIAPSIWAFVMFHSLKVTLF